MKAAMKKWQDEGLGQDKTLLEVTSAMLYDFVRELERENELLKQARTKKLWGDHVKVAHHPEGPRKLLELDVPKEINEAALDVGCWMEGNDVRELWGLALRTELSSEVRRLNQACDHIRDMLEGDDGQAWKEAEKFLRRIGQPVSLAEAKEVQS
jgi:hypothetical protein